MSTPRVRGSECAPLLIRATPRGPETLPLPRAQPSTSGRPGDRRFMGLLLWQWLCAHSGRLFAGAARLYRAQTRGPWRRWPVLLVHRWRVFGVAEGRQEVPHRSADVWMRFGGASWLSLRCRSLSAPLLSCAQAWCLVNIGIHLWCPTFMLQGVDEPQPRPPPAPAGSLAVV